MSRLERFIARMQAQRVLLDQACMTLNKLGSAMPGPVIELGLGNGRTYDHLKENLVDRRVIVFERSPKPHPRSLPPPEDLYVGEIETVARKFTQDEQLEAVMVHADLGDGTPAYNQQLETWLPQLCVSLTKAGGWVVTSTPLVHADLKELPLPAEVHPGTYFFYRRSEPAAHATPAD